MSKPIYIFEGGGLNPHVVASIDTDKYSDHDSRALSAIMYKRVNNVSTLEIKIPTNCDASKAITNTSDIVLWDTDGNVHEFHITDIDDLDEYSVERVIYAEESICELMNDIVIKGTMPKTKNPKDYLAYILSNTRWSVGTVDSAIYNSVWEEDITGLNCLEALQKFIDKYNCEFEVRYVTDNKNSITARYIDIKKNIGHNYGKRFENNKDILGLKRNMDLDSVKTAIYPRIVKEVTNSDGTTTTEYIDISNVAWSVANGDPVDKPIGQKILVDPDADSMYKRLNTKDNSLMERIMYAEWTADTATDANDLIKQAWSILRANSVMIPTVEVSAVDLYRLSGNSEDYWHEQVELGDTCTIIDKAFDPELRLQTRVMEIEEDLLNPVNNQYTFGKYRRTLATSNIDQQKSVDEKLAELQSKLQGVTIPESKPQYQTGKVYYEELKSAIQNDFMSANGYVMAEGSDGFWVFNSDPNTENTPSKAVIVKGGAVALASYDNAASCWNVGTFIDGMSVNADFINTGHISAEVIEAGTITAEHLSVAAQEYLKTGLATEEDLNSVITTLQNNYVTNESMESEISSAISGLATDADIVKSRANAIKGSYNVITAEYNNNLQQAVKLMSNKFLTGTAKTKLTNAKKNYVTKYTEYETAVNDIYDNLDTSASKLTAYNSALLSFQQASATLGTCMQEAVIAVNTKVKSDSTAYADSLKVDIDSDIQDVSNALTSLETTMNGTFKDGVISEFESSWLSQEINNLNREKNDVDSEYNVLYANSNLTGSAKTQLSDSKSSYDTAHSNLISEINTAIADNTVTSTEKDAVNTALSSYSTALGNYRTAAQNAINSIADNKIAQASLSEAGYEALQEAINSAIQGMATEDYVDNAVSGVVDQATISSKIEVIKDSQRKLNAEYTSNKAKADEVYADTYLPAGSTEKTNLGSKITAYTDAYNTLDSCITNIISDSNITTAEYNTYVTNASSYSTALKELSVAIEKANNARLANVYAQARQGLVTTADLEVNNESVIATAQLGMVSTGDMTSAIQIATENLIDSDTLNSTVATKVSKEELVDAKIAEIKRTFDTIDLEYVNNKNQAEGIANNSYCNGTPKENLQSAITAYTSKFSELQTTYNDIVSTGTLTTSQLNSWNTCVTNLKEATENLASNAQTALQNINETVHSNSKGYADSLKAATDAEISDVNRVVETLSDTMEGSFREGVISEAEVAAIQSNLRNLTTEKCDIDNDFSTLYENTLLSGSVKTALNTAKNNYNIAHTKLVNKINSIITDKVISDTEKTELDTSFSEYNSKLGDYRVAAQNAANSIAESQASDAISKLEVGGKNLLLNSDNGYLSTLNIYKAPEGTVAATVDGWRKFTLTNQLTDREIVQNKWYTPTQTGKYTFSILVKTDAETFTATLSTFTSVGGHKYRKTTITKIGDDLYKLVSTFEISSLDKIRILDLGKVTTTGATYISFRYPMLERGDKASDWSMSPEDIINNAYSYTDDAKTLLNTAINDAVADLASMSDLTSASNNTLLYSKIDTIDNTYYAIQTEYNNNIKQAQILYGNSYLSGSDTAKSNLGTSKTNYTNKFNAVTAARTSIVKNLTLTESQLKAWNSSISDLQSATTNLAKCMQEAQAYINTAIYNASKDYTDNAIPDALTGYAKTSYVDSAKQDAIAAAQDGMVSTTQLEVNNTEILMKTSSMGQSNLLRNTDLRNDFAHWVTHTETYAKVMLIKPSNRGNTFGGTMAGEPNIVLYGLDGNNLGNESVGVSQKVVLVPKVSYTLSYWVNCSGCTCRVSIYSIASDGTETELSGNNYTNINGSHNRNTWKYDSQTVTVPNDSVNIKVIFRVSNSTVKTFRALLVKPMLCTGINAQAWTAHPDEMSIGVVSITDDRGIMVEHNDCNTYTTLDAGGLKIWDYSNDTPIASFGENRMAYIDEFQINKFTSDVLTPTVTLTKNIVLYFSNTGSGDCSGKDSNNCAAGFTGAMAMLCSTLGIDNTHITGNFNVKSTSGGLCIKFVGVGTMWDEYVYLQNITGSFSLQIEIPANMKHYGGMDLYSITVPFVIDGNRTGKDSNNGAILCRTGNINGIRFNHCTDFRVKNLRLRNFNQSYNAIAVEGGSKGIVDVCDIYGFDCSIKCDNESVVFVNNTRGTSKTYGIYAANSLVILSGYLPRRMSNQTTDVRFNCFCYAASARVEGSESPNPQFSVQGSSTTFDAGAVFSIAVENTFSPTGYKSVRSYETAELIQGSYGDTDKYGDYEGRVMFETTKVKSFLSGNTNISGKIYLERSSSAQGSKSATIYIDGTSVGTLTKGEGKWFNLPSSVLTDLANGIKYYIPLTGTGSGSYCVFERNSKIKLACTKKIRLEKG